MVSVSLRLGSLLVLYSLFLGFPALAEVRTTVVPGLGELKCHAYLHLPDEPHPPLPLVFAAEGSGIYTVTHGSLPFRIALAVYRKEVAALVIDRPGIYPDSSFIPGYKLNSTEFAKYTTPDLIECAAQAISWAKGQEGVAIDPAFFLMGHSEGAIVVTRLYQRLLTTDKTLANKVRAIFLAGIPLDPLKDTLDAQLSRDPQFHAAFWDAYHRRDDAWLLDNMGLGSAWLDDSFAAEPLRKTFDELSLLNPDAVFELYQGLQDQAVSATSVMNLEKQNNARASSGQPSLKINAEYFETGHRFNEDEIQAVHRRLAACIANDQCK